MKKIISWVLLLAVILGYTENVYANKYIPKDKVEGTDYYLDEYYEDIYENYRNVMEDFVWEYLKNDKKSIYVGFINETQDVHSIIKETGKYIDEELDEKKYMEILANLMATMDVGVSEIMYHQAEADTLKQTDDYILDAIDIVTETIGLDLEKLNTDIGHELEYIMDSIDINKSIIEFNINNINDLKYYNYLMEKYDLYHEFLDLIINNAETEELKRAAHTLDYFAGQALFANFTYFDEVTRNFEENIGEDVFFNKIVMKMLEEPKIVTDSIENQEALKLLGNIYKKIGLGELVFKIGIFSGDMILGTSNMYNRYNEIYVMKEIRDILIRGIEEEDKKITGIEQYDSIEKVINYLKYMLYVNSRGEYCVYNLVVSDGQLMSLINMGNVDDYNRLIKQVQSINTSLEIQIDNIVPDLFDYKKDNVIENTTDNEQNEELCYYLSEVKIKYSDGDFFGDRFEYDKNGNCIEITEFNEQDEIISRSECINDMNGNMIEQIRYVEGANITICMKYEYDDKNNLKKIIYSDTNGPYAWEENIYDSRGNTIVNTYYQDGEICHKVIRTYDDNKNIVSECIYPLEFSYMTKYEYDEHNKIIKKMEYDLDGNIERRTDYTYEYDSNTERCTGNVYDANGDLVQIVENISETTFTETGKHEKLNYTSYNTQQEIQASYSRENVYIAIKKSKSKDLNAISFDFNPEIVGIWENLHSDCTQTNLMLEINDDFTARYCAAREIYYGAFDSIGDNTIKLYFGNGKIYNNSIAELEGCAIDIIIDAEIDFEKNEMYCQITSDGYTWDVVLNKVE